MMAGAANAAQYERNLVQLLGTIRRSLFHFNPLLPIIMGVQVREFTGAGGGNRVVVTEGEMEVVTEHRRGNGQHAGPQGLALTMQASMFRLSHHAGLKVRP